MAENGGTLKDLQAKVNQTANRAQGAVKAAFDHMKTSGADSPQRVLRGSPDMRDPDAVRASRGAQPVDMRDPARINPQDARVQPRPQVRAASATPAASPTTGPIKSPLDPRFQTPLADHNAKIRTMNNPVLDADATQQRIGAANDRFAPQAEKPLGATQQGPHKAGVGPKDPLGGKIQKAKFGLGKTMARAGVVGGLAAGAGAVSDVMGGNTPEQQGFGNVEGTMASGTDQWGRPMPEHPMVAGLRGGLAQFGDTMALGYGREIGAALGAGARGFVEGGQQATGLGVGARLRNAYAMAKEGWGDAEAAEKAVEGTMGGAVTRGAAINPAVNNSTMTGSSSAEGGDVVNGQRLRAGAVPPGSGVDPATGQAKPIFDQQGNDTGAKIEDGTGAIRNSRTGKVTAIDSRASLRAAPAVPREPRGSRGVVDRGPGLHPAKGQAFSNMPTYNGFETAKARRDAELAVKQDNARTAAGTLAHAQGKERRDTFRRDAENQVRRDPKYSKMDPKEAEGAIKRDVANREAMADYSLRKRGYTMETASPKAMNDFNDSVKWKDAVESGRATLGQALKDFAGTKRFDSQDAFSYRPAFRVGNRVYTENGNSVEIKQAVGGGKNLLSPNDPIDKDMHDYVKNLPTREEYEKQLKDERDLSDREAKVRSHDAKREAAKERAAREARIKAEEERIKNERK